MSNYKRGDVVKVVHADRADKRVGINKGDTYTVGAIDPDGDLYLIGTFTNYGGGMSVCDAEKFKDYVDGSHHIASAAVVFTNQVKKVS